MPPTVAELLAAGWRRCFIADEPRLSEAVATYHELGFEVLLLPIELEEQPCSICLQHDPARFRVIYARRLGAP